MLFNAFKPKMLLYKAFGGLGFRVSGLGFRVYFKALGPKTLLYTAFGLF